MIFKVCCESINFLYFTLGKNINLLWFQLSRNFPSENIIEMHGNANWGGDKVLLEFFWPRRIRVWQRCDRCRSYHAREAGCASHKINLFPPTFQSFWNDLLDDGFTSKPIAFIRLQSFRGNPRLCLLVNIYPFKSYKSKSWNLCLFHKCYAAWKFNKIKLKQTL